MMGGTLPFHFRQGSGLQILSNSAYSIPSQVDSWHHIQRNPERHILRQTPQPFFPNQRIPQSTQIDFDAQSSASSRQPNFNSPYVDSFYTRMPPREPVQVMQSQ